MNFAKKIDVSLYSIIKMLKIIQKYIKFTSFFAFICTFSSYKLNPIDKELLNHVLILIPFFFEDAPFGNSRCLPLISVIS